MDSRKGESPTDHQCCARLLIEIFSTVLEPTEDFTLCFMLKIVDLSVLCHAVLKLSYNSYMCSDSVRL